MEYRSLTRELFTFEHFKTYFHLTLSILIVKLIVTFVKALTSI